MKCSIDGRKVTLEFEISEDPQESKSGKSLILASTHGYQSVVVPGMDEPAKFSLNMIHPLNK